VEHPREKAVAVKIKHPYVILITSYDGIRREIHIEPLLWGEVFASLRDPALFVQVAVDPTFGSVCWPTGTDLVPEFLYLGYDTPTVASG
jgi:hypothetical protein